MLRCLFYASTDELVELNVQCSSSNSSNNNQRISVEHEKSIKKSDLIGLDLLKTNK